MELEQCINFVLTKAQNAVQQLFKAELAPYGVTPGQYAVLKCLWDQNGQTAKQLAERLYLDGSTVTGILDRMENKFLIKRQPDAKDRRAVRVMLTDRGRELNKPVNLAVERANHKTLEKLGAKETVVLKKLLEELNHAF